jgi:hypothetical protein
MRTTLAVIVLSFCTAILFSDVLPLTVDEISLMLRSGYSSDDVIRELSTRHFGEAYSADVEKELARYKASPALIEALKSNKYAASPDEMRRAQAKVAEMKTSAQGYANQEKVNAKLAVEDSREKLVEERRVEGKPWRARELQATVDEERIPERAKARDRRIAELTEAAQSTNQTGLDQDRRQAQELINKLRVDLSRGHSREQLEADLRMADGQGPKTREVAERMRTDLAMAHSREQLKRDLVKMESSLAGNNQ